MSLKPERAGGCERTAVRSLQNMEVPTFFMGLNVVILSQKFSYDIGCE